MTLDEEKQKLKYGHKLELWRIIWEKLLLASILAVAGLIANYWFEDYKSHLEQSRFLLEARLDALKDLRVAYNALSHDAYSEMDSGKPTARESYDRDLQTFFRVMNRSGFLFSEEFMQTLAHHAWLHQAVSDPQFQLSREHWPFMADVAESFDSATRQALVVEVLGGGQESQANSFRLQIWKKEDVAAKGAVELFRDNYKKWRSERKK